MIADKINRNQKRLIQSNENADNTNFTQRQKANLQTKPSYSFTPSSIEANHNENQTNINELKKQFKSDGITKIKSFSQQLIQEQHSIKASQNLTQSQIFSNQEQSSPHQDKTFTSSNDLIIKQKIPQKFSIFKFQNVNGGDNQVEVDTSQNSETQSLNKTKSIQGELIHNFYVNEPLHYFQNQVDLIQYFQSKPVNVSSGGGKTPKQNKQIKNAKNGTLTNSSTITLDTQSNFNINLLDMFMSSSSKIVGQSNSKKKQSSCQRLSSIDLQIQKDLKNTNEEKKSQYFKTVKLCKQYTQDLVNKSMPNAYENQSNDSNSQISQEDAKSLEQQQSPKEQLTTRNDQKINISIDNKLLHRKFGKLKRSSTFQVGFDDSVMKQLHEKQNKVIHIKTNKDINTSTIISTKQVDKHVDEQGAKLINDYQIIKKLGRGQQGKVKLVKNLKDNRLYALKIAKKHSLKIKVMAQKVDGYSLLQKEIAIMKKLDHPNIVKLYEVIDNVQDKEIYLVMEYLENGSLLSPKFFNKYLDIEDYDDEDNTSEQSQRSDDSYKLNIYPKTVSEERAKKYFRDLALGLDYLHNYVNVIHRDIKPENLLIDNEDNLKIADFGISQIIENDYMQLNSTSGTQAYLPPETYEKKKFKGKPLDIWAAGVTLYQMIFGKHPYHIQNRSTLKEDVLSSQLSIRQMQPDCDSMLIDLIEKLLEKNPEKRITAKDILVHPWVTDNGNVTLKNQIDGEFDLNKEDFEHAIAKLNLNVTFMIVNKMKKKLSRIRASQIFKPVSKSNTFNPLESINSIQQ